jgi:hypothetical protein
MLASAAATGPVALPTPADTAAAVVRHRFRQSVPDLKPRTA